MSNDIGTVFQASCVISIGIYCAYRPVCSIGSGNIVVQNNNAIIPGCSVGGTKEHYTCMCIGR